MASNQRTIQVQALARVEGEGALTIRLKDDVVEEVELRIYEPPRFYEAFLRGRDAAETPDITARICGICPVAYQMSAVHAIEQIYGVRITPTLRGLRRLLYCGEWIESHVLHALFLHAPDFLGYPGALEMARAKPELADLVKTALRIKKAGNSIVRTVGGREVHPINVRVGGFYRLPRRDELEGLLPELTWARAAVRGLLDWSTTLTYPDFEVDYQFVALQHAEEYPMSEGRIVSSRGLNIDVAEFPRYFSEMQVPHSTALQARLAADGSGYFVGPLARWNLNHLHAPDQVRQAAAEVGLTPPVRNPYRSLGVRLLEVLLAFDEAIRHLEKYEPEGPPFVPHQPRAGVGQAATEAPRGLLYHRYETDDQGLLRLAVIVPPTSQNQAQIEADLRQAAASFVHLPEEEATLKAETIIRNYDPCISCATHFLKLKVERR